MGAAKFFMALLMPVLWTACAILILRTPEFGNTDLRIFLAVVCAALARMELHIFLLNDRKR